MIGLEHILQKKSRSRLQLQYWAILGLCLIHPPIVPIDQPWTFLLKKKLKEKKKEKRGTKNPKSIKGKTGRKGKRERLGWDVRRRSISLTALLCVPRIDLVCFIQESDTIRSPFPTLFFISLTPVFYQGQQSNPHPYTHDRHSHPLPPLSCLGIAPDTSDLSRYSL